jgi:DNA invertase Pin-like site-specific DNA recombinase
MLPSTNDVGRERVAPSARIFGNRHRATTVEARRRGVGAPPRPEKACDVTGNDISKLVFTILSAVAEAERDRVREPIREVKADQRKRRRYLGGIVPFGWQIGDGGALVEVADQQRAIQRILELRRNGVSLRSISTTLVKESIKLSHEGVKNVLAATEDRSR